MNKTEFILDQLTIDNWKGVKSMTINFNEVRTEIAGQNGSNKSTVIEAWLWLITGKDSQDRTDYEIKNTEYPDLNRLDHTVQAIGRKNGRKITLRRVYSEVWTRKSGSETPTKTGNTTKYFVDDAPFTSTTYDAFINTWIAPTTFKMLTNPLFFNTIVKGRWEWTNQRDILIKMAGEIAPAEIFESFDITQERQEILTDVLESGKTFDLYKKELAVKTKLAKEALVKVSPDVIEQLVKSKPEIEDWKALESLIKKSDEKYSEINDLVTNKALIDTDRVKNIALKKTEINELKNRIAVIEGNLRNQLKADNDLIRNQITDLKTGITRIEGQIRDVNTVTLAKKATYGKLFDSYEISKLAFEQKKIEVEPELPEEYVKCQACGQDLERDKVEESKVKFLNDWRTKKAASVVSLKLANTNTYNEAVSTKKVIDESKSILETYNADLLSKKKELSDLELKPLKGAPELKVLIDAEPEIKQLNADILVKETELKELELIDKDELLEKLKVDRTNADTTRMDLRKRFNNKEQVEKIDTSVKEMTIKSQALNQEIATYEGLEFAMKQYGLARNRLVQVKVNDMFEEVSFKMFETQENGEPKETCELLYFPNKTSDGVPYNTLSTGQKTYAGLQCVKALNKFYDAYMPVMCDNMESSFKVPEMNSQMILLFADKYIETITVFDSEADRLTYSELKRKEIISGIL